MKVMFNQMRDEIVNFFPELGDQRIKSKTKEFGMVYVPINEAGVSSSQVCSY